ncbi:MAG TPA: acyl-CoA dehydrogenase family protein [Chthonomonadaceae bacterium]|nr:acyl-CoA dehydrogenase family protein [Chthonomonadaceae bacterium]
MSESSLPATPRGGEFLLAETAPEQVFIPESLSAEARLMAKTMEEFLRKEVLPVNRALEAQEPGLMPALIQKAGSLGLLAGGVPEAYGGLALPKSALALLTEKAALHLSFAISISVHSGVATLPLLYFGTPEQKQRYLPSLATGERIGAFALSEANCGSDALSAQTKATLAADGAHYLLNGTKMWTTNGGFADLFTVFAKVDGEALTAFLVERETPGVSLGGEEHKMGLHGSSTRRILFQDAPIPSANVLGEVGKGHRPALYALNVGRFNIGVTALGAAKECLRMAARYAQQRVQFGQPIVHFGLIQHKLGEMAVRLFVLESMVYRTAGCWDGALDDSGAVSAEAERLRAASEEYAIESALLKFFGTEVLDHVVDESLQIHGGYGYSEEFPIAQMYRDARVFRIFEGTNEINRLAVLDQLLRRARTGRLPLQQALTSSSDLLVDSAMQTDGDPLAAIGLQVRQIRATILHTLGVGWEILSEHLTEQQEVAAALADMIAALYAMESSWLRLRKLGNAAPPSALAAVQVYGDTACAQVAQAARTALAALTSGGAHGGSLPAFPSTLLDTIAQRRQVAVAVLEREGYPW